MDETLLTVEELQRSLVYEEGRITYARIPKRQADFGDYFFKGDKAEVTEPFTSANTVQLNAEGTLRLIQEAKIL